MGIEAVWADPVKAAACRKAQSEGAKKRWADPVKRRVANAAVHTPKAKKERLDTLHANLAASFGLTLKEWRAMTKLEREHYAWNHPRISPPTFKTGSKYMERWSKRLERPAAELLLLSGIEMTYLKLKLKWKSDKNKEKNHGTN